jgi:hypothetical protein
MNKIKISHGAVKKYGASSANTAQTLTIDAQTGLFAVVNKILISVSGAAIGAAGCVVDVKEGTAATTIATLSIPATAAIGTMLNVDFPGGLAATAKGNKLDVVVGAGGAGAVTTATVLGDYSA